MSEQILETIKRLRLDYRIGPFAAIDVIGSVGGSWAIANAMDWPFLPTLAGTVSAGVAVHEVLGVSTPGNRMLFPNSVPPQEISMGEGADEAAAATSVS